MSMWQGFTSVFFLIVGLGGLMTIIALLLGPTPGKTRAPLAEKVACAICGRYFHREEMVPSSRNGEIVWLCHDEVKKGLDKPVPA